MRDRPESLFLRAGFYKNEIKIMTYSLRVSSFTGSEEHERSFERAGSPRRYDDFITVMDGVGATEHVMTAWFKEGSHAEPG